MNINLNFQGMERYFLVVLATYKPINLAKILIPCLLNLFTGNLTYYGKIKASFPEDFK